MGLIGSLATVFYRINEGIIYSSIFVYILGTIINLNTYSTDPSIAHYISYLMSLNLPLYLESLLGNLFGSNGVIAGASIGGLLTISALFARNYVLNLSQQTMGTLQIIFIYLVLQFIFTSFESITAYIFVILLPMTRSISLPFLAPPLQLFVYDLSLIIDFLASFGEVMSIIYVLMATGMWTEM
jgi:hypothetical protein